MNPEDLKELKDLVEFLKENQIGEFDLDRGDMKVRIKFAQERAPAADLAGLSRLLSAAPATAPIPQPVVSAAQTTSATAQTASETAATPVDDNAGLHIVKSPIVGTFYEAPSAGMQAFVKEGDQVENGQVLCIVEAMKLMNEIESDAAGEIVKRLVTNGQPVEYGQPLFALRLR